MDSGVPKFDDLYRDIILDHYRRPRGRKALECPDVENEGQNPVCGDEVKVSLKFDGDRVKDVSVQGRGCAISTAAGSMLAEILPGKTAEEVEALMAAVKRLMHDAGPEPPTEAELGDLEALSGVRHFPVRVKCALLAWVTLAEAIRDWQARSKDDAGTASGACAPGCEHHHAGGPVAVPYVLPHVLPQVAVPPPVSRPEPHAAGKGEGT
jgi:nitrogen fixation NifU-like protein